jgi:hypothetical protein
MSEGVEKGDAATGERSRSVQRRNCKGDGASLVILHSHILGLPAVREMIT